MGTAISLFTFLFLIAALIGITGIIFLIVGLINNNKKMWIPEAIASVLALILVIVAIVFTVSRAVGFVSNKAMESIDYMDVAIDEIAEEYDYDEGDYSYFGSEELPYSESKYFYVCDNYRQTFLYVHEDFSNITIENYSKKDEDNDNFTLRLEIYFEEDVDKTSILKVFDETKQEIGRINVHIKGKAISLGEQEINLSGIKDICETKYFTIE